MAKSLKDIIGPRAGRNVSKDEEDILDTLKVDKKEDPAGNKDDVFNATKVPAEAGSQKADPGKRHGYRTIQAAAAAYEETVVEQKKKKPLTPEDDRNVNGKDYGYAAGAKGNGSAVSEASTLGQSFNNPDAKPVKGAVRSKFSGPEMKARAEAAKKKAMAARDKAQNEEVELEEGGMPASVIKHKTALSQMTDKEFAEKHGHKSEKELRDMAGRHGYGWDKATKTGSDHYVKRAKKGMSEEVEQVDELDRNQGSMINRYIRKTTDDPKRKAGRDLALLKKHGDKNYGLPEPKVKAVQREETEELDEVLKSSDPTSKWISHFVHSKNPKFAGKSKKQRIQQALGAKYAKMREEFEAELSESHNDYEGQMAKTQLKALANKAMNLVMMMQDNQELEAWVQAKLTNAKHDIDAVHDYLTYGDHEDNDDKEMENEITGPDTPISYPNMNIDTSLGRA